MRLRHKPWAEDYLKSRKFVYFKPQKKKKKWNKKVFKNKNEIHLEIGMGKGSFLEQHFIVNPNINYIGIEKEKSVIVVPAKRYSLSYPDLSNFVLVCADAENIDEWFMESSIQKIYINFPDPWPKNRHEKRRLNNLKFLEKYHKILKDNGEIEFKSDQVVLYNTIKEALSYFSGFKVVVDTSNLHASAQQKIVMTEYEKRFVSQKLPIFYMKLIKV